ncbi:Trk system potassium transporter TrkA [Clostridium sartagoforme]|uniref:Trk system potassium uptake protein TrkA n=1 Tax=Clostridium sartagoforme TaxID=84031 RepID=A0A4S2DSK8_9CLOT|nr:MULTISPECIES: Trk system potassium transporter TrkA [Clostridium]MBS5937464.1 Trk system potassium transporter TrkA [Clostridium sp.]TGY44224.1 Trk system potassium transporter TrkA [Clostridium sartagoforme]
MNIVIVGAGKVGYTLAQYLSIDGDNITMIDKKDLALEHVNNNLDVMCVKGNATSLKVLEEAGVREADLLISVTDSDELNMLCSLAAKKLGAKYTVARVRNPSYDEEITLLTEAVGIDLVINPEKAAAIEIAKLIKYPSVCNIDNFSDGKVNLVGFKVKDTALEGKRISDIAFIRGNVLFCGVERNDEFILPKGDYVFNSEDRVYVIGEHKDIQNLFNKLGKYKKKVKRAMIVGGGKIAYYLAKIINEVGVSCKIIEKDLTVCEELNELLPNSIVINGDGMDEELLLSESLLEVDSFITLTGRDEDNIIASILAYNKSVSNVITKITRDNYRDIGKAVGINTMVNPKLVTAYKILKYVRSLKNKKKSFIENIYRICNDKAEAVEFIVGSDTTNINEKFKNIEFNENALVATIVRNNKIIIPTGDDYLKVNDRVIIVSKDMKIVQIDDIFRRW